MLDDVEAPECNPEEEPQRSHDVSRRFRKSALALLLGYMLTSVRLAIYE